MATLWNNYRYLFFRRFTQLSILVLYFLANAWGWSVLKGNLSSSLLLNTVPLSDPYAALQMLAAGAVLSADLLLGAFIVTIFYLLIGGRVFCSWVCPVNIVTDAAALLRRKLGVDAISRRQPASRNMRYWVLVLSLIISAIMGITAFEFISPISMLHRGIVFGLGFGWAAMLIIFLFDLFVLKNGWCGHVCPLGGFYSLLGNFSLIRVSHSEENCTLCMKCKTVCPEHQVLHMVGKESLPVLSGECTNCARCIEVCDDDALNFSIRNLAKNKTTGE
ncbi:quinol dehydrogenase ferredoxin subunit NapH [Candidatus Sulfurimonas marisnigri]|uniref:Quinol dehydrogenase ferredoxin subunit NapH n=1 Tax=Candidatus Sulfurimonas marisnigri TaxID=2740405 RepID=A0A7S7LZ63_9BACT|nr:quinol dehydrogenase ferredoxin subunit NapH [Candidatus Sulfurimonas marisnigri]QOY54137.1 quinol dehydrogenase ferredoxin subunit NapH [Candidatus Sulfurimonas marisnigri]